MSLYTFDIILHINEKKTSLHVLVSKLIFSSIQYHVKTK